jgi:hypothetical protein
VRVRSLDKQCNTLGVLDLFNERELLFSKDMFVNKASPAKIIWCKIIYRVLGNTTANKLKSLHVASLCSAKGKDVVLGENIQRKRINTLLVDDHETVVSVFTGADGILEFYDLADLIINVLSFGFYELLALFGGRIEESRVDFTVAAP